MVRVTGWKLTGCAVVEQLPLNLAATEDGNRLCDFSVHSRQSVGGGQAVGGLQLEQSDVILSSGDSLQSRKRSPSGLLMLRLRNIVLLEGSLLPGNLFQGG